MCGLSRCGLNKHGAVAALDLEKGRANKNKTDERCGMEKWKKKRMNLFIELYKKKKKKWDEIYEIKIDKKQRNVNLIYNCV